MGQLAASFLEVLEISDIQYGTQQLHSQNNFFSRA